MVKLKMMFILPLLAFWACDKPVNKGWGQEEKIVIDSAGIYFDSLVHSGKDALIRYDEFKNFDNSKSFIENARVFLANRRNGEIMFSERLAKIKEKHLDSLTRYPGDEAYRLILSSSAVWAIPYDHYLTILKSKDFSDSKFSYRLSYRKTTGWDYLVKVDSSDIDETSWNEFRKKLEKADFWASGESDRRGLDGYSFTIEGYQVNEYTGKQKYWSVNRWAPGNTAFKDACVYLIGLYDKKILKEYNLP